MEDKENGLREIEGKERIKLIEDILSIIKSKKGLYNSGMAIMNSTDSDGLTTISDYGQDKFQNISIKKLKKLKKIFQRY